MQVERVLYGGQRVCVTYVAGHLLAGRSAQDWERVTESLMSEADPSYFRINDPMQALRGRGHDEVKHDRRPRRAASHSVDEGLV